MTAQIESVANSANEVCPIKIGEKVPSAIVVSLDGKEMNIQDIVKEKNSIIIFYRGGWCPYCNLHLSDLQQYEHEILKAGYQIIALSMDKFDILSATIDKHNLSYTLYSDSKANASKAFGIAFRVDHESYNRLKSFNLDIEKSSGESHRILPVPSVFVVNKDEVIIFNYVNPNYKQRLSGKLLLEIIKQLK